MIGYEISSSLAGVYTIAKTSLVENFKHELKNDMINCQHDNIFFC